MPPQNPNTSNPNNETIMSFKDNNGDILLEVRENDFMTKNPNGSYDIKKNYEAVTLADGSSWSPLFLRKDPPVFLGKCEFPGHKMPLIALSRGRICCRCGKFACPKHRVKRDDKWFCRRCDKIELLKQLLKPIFFKEVE